MHWMIFLRYLLLNRSLCPDLTFLRQCSKGLSFVGSIILATWISISKGSKYSKEPCVVPVSYYRISPIFLQFWWVLYYIFRSLSPIFLYFWTPKAIDTLQTVWESRYRQLSVIGRQSIRRDWGRQWFGNKDLTIRLRYLLLSLKHQYAWLEKELKNLQSELFNNTLNNIPFLFFVLIGW